MGKASQRQQLRRHKVRERCVYVFRIRQCCAYDWFDMCPLINIDAALSYPGHFRWVKSALYLGVSQLPA